MIGLKIERVGLDELHANAAAWPMKSRLVTHQGLRDLGDKIRDSVKDELKSPSAGKYSFVWQEDEEGSLIESVEAVDVSDIEVDIVDNEEPGKWIRYGAQTKNVKKAPSKLVHWCMTKLRINEEFVAYATALNILENNILTPERQYGDGGGYDYPRYVIEEKEQATLQQAADQMAGLIVKYLGE